MLSASTLLKSLYVHTYMYNYMFEFQNALMSLKLIWPEQNVSDVGGLKPGSHTNVDPAHLIH